MKRPLFYLANALAVGGIATIALASQCVWNRQEAQLKAQTAKLRDYCSSVSVAMRMDADDLANGTEKRKLAAASRFGEQVTFHSEYEIALCAKQPVDLTTRPACAIGPNYDCLAKLARAAHEAVKP